MNKHPEETIVRCDCGKILFKVTPEKIKAWCKPCKKEVETGPYEPEKKK